MTNSKKSNEAFKLRLDNKLISQLNTSKTWFNLNDPLNEPVPNLEFIVKGYCARGLITVIGGSAGSGKSLLNQYLLQKRSDELLNTCKGKAIFLTGADSSESEIRRRAKCIKVNDGLYTVELPEDQLWFATNEKFMKELTAQLKSKEIDTVIFDTLADFHDGNLYEAELANQTMKRFRLLARDANVAVVLITHTKKGSKAKKQYDVEDISDSRIFSTKADFVFALKSEYQSDESNLIELICVKSRSTKAIKPIRAEIFYNDNLNKLIIKKSDRLYSYESERQSKIEERQKKINEVHNLKAEGFTHQSIADELEISKGSVANFLKETPTV